MIIVLSTLSVCQKYIKNSKYLLRRLVSFFLLIFTISCYSEEHSVVLWNRNFDTAPVDQFLALAFRKTEDLYPPVSIVRSASMEQDQAIAALLDGNSLDIMSAASSVVHDEQFITLRFPILKGLLGHRLCLIRSGEQSFFDQIRTAYDFVEAKLTICQGLHWPDTAVLQRNGLPVVTSSEYQELFVMLQDGRCDCFLRGAQEIGPELQAHQPLLTLEENLVIRYSQPGVIYVRKDKPELATRLELGLLRALEDGSYEALFERLLGESLAQLHMDKRYQILLNNPAQSSVLRDINGIRDFDFQP